MPGNRTQAERYVLTMIGKMTDNSPNVDIYREYFKSLSDKEFEQWIDDIESGKKFLTIEMPNYGKHRLDVNRNIELSIEMGFSFFEQLWIEGQGDRPTYLTPIEYMVLDQPTRRASQLLTKKISVPKHNRVIDALTGQPTGDSKGAKLSYPELQVMIAMGMEETSTELMKFRGGDNRGRAAMNGMLSRHGVARQESLKAFSSGVESTKQLKTFLLCAHLQSTL